MILAESILSPSLKILDKTGKQLIEDIKESQKGKKLIASGRSAASLRYTIIDTGKTFSLSISGASWWYWQENGRARNSIQGRPSTAFIKIIELWIQSKGLSIPLKAAGAIAYKIMKEGIRVPNKYNSGGVLSEPLAIRRINSMIVPEIKEGFIASIKNRIKSVLSKWLQ